MNPENCVRWRFEEAAMQTKRRWRLLAVVLGGAQYISITHLGGNQRIQGFPWIKMAPLFSYRHQCCFFLKCSGSCYEFLAEIGVGFLDMTWSCFFVLFDNCISCVNLHFQWCLHIREHSSFEPKGPDPFAGWIWQSHSGRWRQRNLRVLLPQISFLSNVVADSRSSSLERG